MATPSPIVIPKCLSSALTSNELFRIGHNTSAGITLPNWENSTSLVRGIGCHSFKQTTTQTNMAVLNSMPRQILREITTLLRPRLVNLRNCSLSRRALWHVAAPSLYNRVDLSIADRGDEDDNEKSVQRQLQLLRSISECVHFYRFISKLITIPAIQNWGLSYEVSRMMIHGNFMMRLWTPTTPCSLKQLKI